VEEEIVFAGVEEAEEEISKEAKNRAFLNNTMHGWW
jgi:hypothetical protein